MHPELLCREHHQQGLAAPLEMPDEALLRVALHNAVDDLVRGKVLLVATDDLDTPVLLVGREQREVLEDIENDLWPQHAPDGGADMMQLTFLLALLIPPGPPHVDWHADGAIPEQFPFSGERKDVRHEHRRDLLLVDLVHLERTVEPRDRAARRCLRFADHQRQPVHQEHDVKSLFDRPSLVGPLVAHGHAVVCGIGGVH